VSVSHAPRSLDRLALKAMVKLVSSEKSSDAAVQISKIEMA
jgi:hypothetical protein